MIRAVVRALGAGPAMAMADGLLGVLGAILAGSLLAVAVAVALSPLASIGPVRPLYPDIGVAFDWTVLGLGLLVFVVLLTAAALVTAYRVAPHRLAQRAASAGREAAWSRAAASAGLSPSAVLGIRSALGGRSGRDAAPVRSALLGAVVAITVIVTSLTFASSLNALVSQPALYGWNWNYALLAGFSAAENLPAAETATQLDHDPDVAGASQAAASQATALASLDHITAVLNRPSDPDTPIGGVVERVTTGRDRQLPEPSARPPPSLPPS